MANNLLTGETLTDTPNLQHGEGRQFYPLGNEQGYSLAVCAIPSETLKTRILKVTEAIRKKFPEHHYAPNDYLHLTIVHLGIFATTQEIECAQAEHDSSIRDIANKIPTIKVIAEGVGHFPNCFFTEVFDETENLDELHRLLSKLPTGVSQPLFVPHITMGYPKQDAREDVHDLTTHINNHYARLRIGEDIISTLHLTAFNTQRSLNQSPIEILESYSLKP